MRTSEVKDPLLLCKFFDGDLVVPPVDDKFYCRRTHKLLL